MSLYFEDTHPEMEKLLIEKMREMTATEKLEMVGQLNRAAEEMARAGLKKRYPNANEDELRLRLGALRLGREIMVKYFNWDPEVEGW